MGCARIFPKKEIKIKDPAMSGVFLHAYKPGSVSRTIWCGTMAIYLVPTLLSESSVV